MTTDYIFLNVYGILYESTKFSAIGYLVLTSKVQDRQILTASNVYKTHMHIRLPLLVQLNL